MKRLIINGIGALSVFVLAPINVSFADLESQLNQNTFLGTYKSVGSCALFNGGAVVEISEKNSVLTRYENPKFAPGLIIQSYWYPYQGYGDSIINHERRYKLPMINAGGWYKTTFSMDSEKMRYQVTEKSDSNSKSMVRQIVELVKDNSNSMTLKSFYGMSPPASAEFQKSECRLVKISSDEYEKIKKENGPYTSGDNQ
jgi:hypothetical protein